MGVNFSLGHYSIDVINLIEKIVAKNRIRRD